ncbi:MAG: chemotaxis protein [Thermotaleaceae bacterium]
MAENKILLESGTNELEIVEFSIGESVFGINVAKVREIINSTKVVGIPNSSPYMEGVFQLRDRIVPLIDLAKYLGFPTMDKTIENRIIVTEFNQLFCGFHVQAVSRIHRISWENIEAPSALTTSQQGVVTGVIKMEERMILLLDFEKIVYDIAPSTSMQRHRKDASGHKSHLRKDKQIMIAEDSEMLLQMLTQLLQEAGYSNQIHFKNGKEAWEHLEASAVNGSENIKMPDLIITDIEMPKMDGHHLTKRIKESREFSSIPVIIFSSLINEQMYGKGVSIGADEQVSKPDIDKLIDMIDKHIL